MQMTQIAQTDSAFTCHWKDSRHPIMERMLHEVALVAAACLQAQHAIARGACQRTARQVLSRHVLQKHSPSIRIHVFALMRRLQAAAEIDPACFTRRCAVLAWNIYDASSAAHLHANAPAALDPAILPVCPGRIHAHMQEGCIRICHHKQASAAPCQTPLLLLSGRRQPAQDISSSACFNRSLAGSLDWSCMTYLVSEDW